MSDKETAPTPEEFWPRWAKANPRDAELMASPRRWYKFAKAYAVECRVPAPQPAEEVSPEPHDGWMNAWLSKNIPKDQNCGYLWNENVRKLAGDWADFRLAATPQVTPTQGKREAFKEVEGFIAANGRNADIQSFVEKKICELEGTSEQASPTPEQFPSRSQEKRIRTMRGDKKPLDPRAQVGEVERG